MLAKLVKTVSGEELALHPMLKELKADICPITQNKGLIVKKIALRNHVQEKYWDIISDKNYFFCSAKDCPIIYFNNEQEYYFAEKDVKTRVSHKSGPEPRPICYCLSVLEHRILDEILDKKCCTTLEDIKHYTGARTGKLCYITNPSGRCCGPQVNEVIAKGLHLLHEDSLLAQDLLKTVHSGCEYCQDTPEFLTDSINQVVDTCTSCNIATDTIKNTDD